MNTIRLSDLKFSTIEKVAIAFYFLVEINAELFAYRAIYIASVAMLILTFLMKGGLRFYNNRYIGFMLLWLLAVVFSLFYTESERGTSSAVMTVAVRTLVFSSFIYRVRSYRLLNSVFNIILFVSFVNTLFLITMVDLAALGQERLGHTTLDEKWNANAIGLQLSFCVFIIAYLKFKHINAGFTNNFTTICALLFIVVILLTGSRKSLFLLVLPTVMYYMLTGKTSNIQKRLLIVIIAVFLLYQIVMSIEPLYNILGSRVENLINSMGGNEAQDGSISSRRGLIEMGMVWFTQRPLLGYGMNSFEELSGRATGMYWYSHNNFVELLVGVGIVGFVCYYLYYYYILRQSLHKQYREWAFGLSMVISILITEYGLVSWKNFMVQFILAIIFIQININKRYSYIAYENE